MSRIPTIRVHNPAAPGTMMTINEADRRPEHVLWDDAAGASAASAAPLLDPAVRDAAAAITLRVVGLKRRMAGLPFAELSPAEQLAVLHEMAEDIEQGAAVYEARERTEEERGRSDEPVGGTEPASPAPAQPEPAPGSTVSPADLRTSKGPRGLWFVMRGEERVSAGFRTEEEADAEMSRMTAEAA
ncbi:hypothetical protein [Methylobacterium isbiliense]|jgi:hypothetical protein|uniref:Uncharacterized protein n=1 Tax=Methylobacterium isbiliense TaxID=315478 RepID=A0ABQ4SFV7_9HYPH|nr:hypothetical protein [Methylobacterium isbiliense]MDN3622590.1 hypothetical protein [Methylobacterium isbiliense]GJE00561.1 hypothetical protein GMJLKIPL_2484 [Methylobacterium isbiliense]